MKVSREVRGSRGDAPPFKGGRPKREDSHNKAPALQKRTNFIPLFPKGRPRPGEPGLLINPRPLCGVLDTFANSLCGLEIITTYFNQNPTYLCFILTNYYSLTI